MPIEGPASTILTSRRGRIAVTTAVLFLVLAGFSPGAGAQNIPASFRDIQRVVNPRLAVERAYRIRTAVNRAAGRRFAPAASGPAPAALAPGARLISSTEAEGEGGGQARWSVWVDGTHTDLKDSHPVAGYDGTQESLIAGADYQVGDRVVAGVLYTYNESDVRDRFLRGSSSTETHGAGPYLGVVLTDNLVFDASLIAIWTDNTGHDATDTARYDSDGWIAGANLTGYWYFGTLRFSPGFGIAFTRTRDDGYTDTAGRSFSALKTRTGTLTAATTFGYTMALGDTASVEPFLSLEGEWEFRNSTSPSVASSVPVPERDLSLRTSVGVNVSLPRDIYLTIRGDIGGLGQSRFRTYAVNGNISLRF